MSEKLVYKKGIQRPSWMNYMLEHFRVWKDIWASGKFIQSFNAEKKGDGHPVLMIPGFLGSDLSTGRIRRFFKELGYETYGWGLDRNLGDISKLNQLEDRIRQLYEKHQMKVSLVGWSLGGVYSRQLAKANPEYIRQVITMGSPFADIEAPNNARWLYELINNRKSVADADQKWLEDIAAPAPVPTTAIYSKDDGIVPWQACMEKTVDELHQNVQITGGHFGLGFNPDVWVIIEDRLQYKQENWRPYFAK